MGPVRKYKAIHNKINNKTTYSWTMNDNLTPEILIFHMYCILVCFLSPQITICGCEKRSFLSITSAKAFVIPGREYVCCFVVLSSSNTVFPDKTKDFARWNDFPHFHAARQCLINFNSQVNDQLSHQRLLFVNKQHQNCANIDAAMNYSESTSWGKGFIAFLSVNKLLIIFTVSFDVFDGQSSTTDSFGRFSLNSNSLPSSERPPRLKASFSPNIHK